MIILLNGPPGCGKDTIGRMMHKLIPGSAMYKMSSQLKNGLCELLGLDLKLWVTYLSNDWKDEPFDFIETTTTPREALIRLSEDYVKPLFGEDFFGHQAVRMMKGLAARHIIVTDTGFTTEVRPIVQGYGKANVRVLQIHRPGFGFASDSRDYIDVDALGLEPYWKMLNNNHDLDILEAQVKRVLVEWKLHD